MNTESLPQSASGRIRLRNLTFYDTDDILALVNRIEAERPSSSFTWNYAIERSSGATSTKVLELREFTGRPRRTGIGQQVLLLAPVRWRRPMIFRLLPPDKLYDNPLQALVGSAEEQTLPAVMVSELGYALEGLYRPCKNMPRPPTMADVSDFVIRIKKTKLKGTRNRALLARKAELLDDATRKLLYLSTAALRSVRQMKSQSEGMAKYAKALGLDVTKVEQLCNATDQAHDLFSPFEEHLAAISEEARAVVDAG